MMVKWSKMSHVYFLLWAVKWWCSTLYFFHLLVVCIVLKFFILIHIMISVFSYFEIKYFNMICLVCYFSKKNAYILGQFTTFHWSMKSSCHICTELVTCDWPSWDFGFQHIICISYFGHCRSLTSMRILLGNCTKWQVSLYWWWWLLL